jgi:hypothetical protein
MVSYRRLVAPISVTLLILVAGLAFLNLRPSYVGPPPILDPNFELWVGDAGSGKLMLWDLEYVKGIGDQVSLQETAVAGKRAIEFLIMQDGSDSEPVYAYLKQNQTIDGARLTELLTDEIGVWILAEPCNCNGTIAARSIIFGIEVNDGLHTLTFIFSDRVIEATTILAHRFVYLPTQPGTWTYQHINVTEQYRLAQWSLPERLTFSLVFEVGGFATGRHSAYVNSFHVTKPQLHTGPLDSSKTGQSGFSSSDVWCFVLGRFRLSHLVVKGLT